MSKNKEQTNSGIIMGDGSNISAKNVAVGDNSKINDTTLEGAESKTPADTRRIALANNCVFISYRKDDAGGWAAKLANDLRAIVGVHAVFQDDTAGIAYGAQWPDQIAEALEQCRVFLPVIAPSWSLEPNLSRLKEPDDWVRRELITAHNRRKSILNIPVFVNEAPVLDPGQFSGDESLQNIIASLLNHQGIRLDRSPEFWPDKIDGLVSRIESYLGINNSKSN